MNLIDHAKQEYPRECCGVMVVIKGKERYIPCRNISENSQEFIIDPLDYAAAADKGEIVKICHSHVNRSPKPSQADIAGCNKSGLPWVIVSVPSGEQVEFKPDDYGVPLIGRQFHHGVIDCYTIIRDYYAQELGIDIPDFDRSDNWWHGEDNLYLDGYAKAGFERVDDLQKHDVILMQLASNKPNHGAVYIGNNQIIQHQMNRLSSRDVYGGWYQKITTHYLRHEAFR